MWIENHDRLDNSTPGLSHGICGTTTLSTYIDCISYSGNNPHPDPCQPDRGCRKGSGKCPYRHKDRVVILCWKCNFGVGRHWSKKQSLQSWRYLIVDLWCGSHHITTLHRCAQSALFGWLNIYLKNASSMLMKCWKSTHSVLRKEYSPTRKEWPWNLHGKAYQQQTSYLWTPFPLIVSLPFPWPMIHTY